MGRKHTHTHTHTCEWHRMTRMTGPDCVVMCNLINTHTHTLHTKRNGKNTRKKRHLQINKKRGKHKRKKHVWLSERRDSEGRLNEGPRLQRRHRRDEKTKQNKTNVTPEKKRHGICKPNARRIQVRATCG